MAGMKGLITNTVGRILSFPVISSYKEGLSPIEYFITTHGARYGLTATALQTAKAGYLTRRLVDVSQDYIVAEEDCGDKTGRCIKSKADVSGIGVSLMKVIGGRIVTKDVVDKKSGVRIPKGTLLQRDDILKIEESDVDEVFVRTPLTCRVSRGICRQCYGLDLGRNSLVQIGEAVGIVAAQAIGEPGTQLTMRTFHQGGVAEEDITQGLPRVEEMFERRIPKNPAAISRSSGKVLEIKKQNKEHIIIILPELEHKKQSKNEVIEYLVPFGRTPIVSVGQKVKKGDLLTDGSAELVELFKYAGKEITEDYIIHEISRIYDLQGAAISRKHIEVIVRQMFSRKRIKNPGDTHFSVGDIVEDTAFMEENKKVIASGGEEAKVENLVLGISEVALTAKSFLSAASFQNTTRVLIRNAIKGARDELRGLKENVILGRLIPAGTGYRKITNDASSDAEK